jgi:hypothetical protein
VLNYLYLRGEATKVDILRDVFGKTMGKDWTSGEVSTGWGSYLFTYGVRHGYFQKTRKGNRVLWSIR